MRFAWVLALLLGLSACDQVPAAGGRAAPDATEDAAAALIPAGGTFDYRYAFRLPAARIKAVQDSHARGCEALGAARCRIVATRYRVGDDNKIAAVTTLMLDPAIARAFGEAAARTVNSAQGVLVDAKIAGASPAGSGAALIAELNGALQDAAKQGNAAKADRLRAALAAIAEVEGNDPQGNAITPLLVTYVSGTVSPAMGASPDASFRTAGDTFLASLGGLAAMLAGPAPFILLMIVAVVILRKIIGTDDALPAETPAAHHYANGEHRNVLTRWFHRDEERAPEHETS